MRRYAGLGCLAAVVLLVAWAYPYFARARADANRQSCRCNLEQLALGLLNYVVDNDSRLPDAVSWEPVLRPYYKNPSMVICPQDSRIPWYERDPTFVDRHRVSFISYDMVRRWSLQKLPSDKQAATALSFHEVGKTGPDYRHFDGMNAAFLDGHVRWYTRELLPPDAILNGSAPSPPAP